MAVLSGLGFTGCRVAKITGCGSAEVTGSFLQVWHPGRGRAGCCY